MTHQENPVTAVKFMTVSEVAVVLRLSKMTVYRLIRAGDLQALRFGRVFRIPQAAVAQYMRDSRPGR